MSVSTQQQATFDKFLADNAYKAKATKDKYKRWILRLAKSTPKPFEDMTRDDLTAFMHTLKHLKVHSRNTARQVLRFFFKWLGWKNDHFSEIMKYEKVHRKRLTIPTEEELVKIIEAAGATRNGVRDRALLAMLVYGGMRVGAVSAFPPDSWESGEGYMTYEDITLTEERIIEIHIRKAKTRQERTVFITDPNGIAYIQQWRNQHPTKQPNDPFFCTFHHDTWQPLSYNTVLRITHIAATRAGLKGIHPHKFRKARASHMEEQGISRGVIENQGGWQPNSPVLREYVEMNPNKVKERLLEVSGVTPPTPKPKPKGRVDCRLCERSVPAGYAFCPQCGAPTSPEGSQLAYEAKTERLRISRQLNALQEEQAEKWQKFKKEMQEALRAGNEKDKAFEEEVSNLNKSIKAQTKVFRKAVEDGNITPEHIYRYAANLLYLNQQEKIDLASDPFFVLLKKAARDAQQPPKSAE